MKAGIDTNKREIVIYIHPTTGPVTPMKLDLMAVQVAALKVPDARRDEFRVREIVKCIRASFPKVDPEGSPSGREQVAVLQSRLAHISLFNGVVLRLPGTIDAPEARVLSRPVVEQVEQITREVEQLKETLLKEQESHKSTRDKLVVVENRYKQLLVLYDKLNDELAKAKQQVQHYQANFERARELAKQFRMALDNAEREVGSLRLQREQGEQKVSHLQETIEQQATALEELSKLRQFKVNAEQAERQLRATIKVREQEIEQLHVRLRRLMESDETEQQEDTEDPFKNM